MKAVCRLLVAIVIGCCLVHVASARMVILTEGTNAASPRHISLWNGHDLTGWKTFFTNADANVTDMWSAQGDVLALTGKPLGYLRTERSFANYHLHLEWRWPRTNGNSGVFVHLSGTDALWPRSVECQLKSGSAGELIAQGGVDFSGSLISGKKRAKIAAPRERPVGEWNSYDIYCRGNTIEAQVNGLRQNLIEKVSVESGAIGLQLEGHPVEFRQIWVELL